jgi:hypothetical protein
VFLGSGLPMLVALQQVAGPVDPDRRVRSLVATLVADRRVRVIAKTKLERVLGHDGPCHNWDWSRFAAQLPDADGYYAVSAVGFAASKTNAYVYAGHQCSNCGSSHTITNASESPARRVARVNERCNVLRTT